MMQNMSWDPVNLSLDIILMLANIRTIFIENLLDKNY